MLPIYALKRKCKRIQKKYDLKSEELRRLREKYVIEVDPSHKFKYEKQIERLEQGLKQLEQELERLEYLLEHPEEIPAFQWDYSTLAINFSSTIDFLTKYFVGREEAIKQMGEFILTHKSGYFAIVGPPGIGKSALVAHIVKASGAVHHFVGDKDDLASSHVFLRSIVKQLHQKFNLEFEKEEPLDSSGWAELYHKWMKEISAEESLIIFVDALDEAQHYGGGDILKYLPHELPDNVYFVLTSRPELKRGDIISVDTTTFERYELSCFSPSDIEAYFGKNGISLTSKIASIISEKSEGNPLYLYYLIQDCKDKLLTEDFAAQLPKGLEEFYERQWKERIRSDDADINQRRKQILILLILLKIPATEEILLELTDLDSSELDGYIEPLRRFMRPGEQYDIFHGTFKEFIQKKFEKSLLKHHKKLVEYLWNWCDLKDEIFKYALSWLPTHLLETRQYKNLFVLTRNEAFQQTQVQIFPDDPDLPLRTLQSALQGAIEEDDAALMTEFLLAYARQREELKQESPLEALRNGNLKRALELADLYGVEDCILWYLLLIWELKDRARLQDAQRTMQRLLKKELPKTLSRAEAIFLAQVYDVDRNSFAVLCQQVFNSSDVYTWMVTCFLEQKRFDVAYEIFQGIQQEEAQVQALCDLAVAYSHFADVKRAKKMLAEAIMKVQYIKSESKQINALQKIASAQAQVEDTTGIRTTYTTAVKTALEIKDEGEQADALQAIATTQVQTGDATLAIETAQHIENKHRQADVLQAIAEEQLHKGDITGARTTYVTAVETGQQTEDKKERAAVLRAIAMAQVAIKEEFDVVLKTLILVFEAELQSRFSSIHIQRILAYIFVIVLRIVRYLVSGVTLVKYSFYNLPDKGEWLSLLYKHTVLQTQIGDVNNTRNTFTALFKMAQHIKDGRTRENFLERIAEAQGQTGDIPGAIETMQCIESEGVRTNSLQKIAKTQAEIRELPGAVETVYRIKDESSRTYALRQIARIRGQLGDTIGVRTIYTTAFKTAHHIKDEKVRSNALWGIAIEQARTGDILGALKRTPRIGKIYTLTIVASELARTGEFVTATDIAQHINDKRIRAKILEQIAMYQLPTEEVTASAIKIVEGIKGKNKPESEIIFSLLAKAKAQIGDIPGAIKTVQCIKDERERWLTLVGIIMERARAEDITGVHSMLTAAIKIAQRIKSELKRSSELGTIAMALIQVGNIPEVIEMMQHIKHEVTRAFILSRIAMMQVQTGDIPGAIEIAQCIEHVNIQAKVLREIAKAQVQAGDFPAAFKTARDIENNYLHLLTIATIQARTNDIPGAIETMQRTTNCKYLFTKVERASAPRDDIRINPLKKVERTSDLMNDIFVEILQEAERTSDLMNDMHVNTLRQFERARDPGNDILVDTLKEVATAQARSGNIPGAIEMVQYIRHEYRRAEALKTISLAKAQLGEFSEAIAITRRIEDKEQQVDALKEIALVAQAQGRELPKIIEIIQYIEVEECQTETLKEVIVRQIQARQFSLAIKTVQYIKDEYRRVDILKEIAVAQAKGGLLDDALRTSDLILLNRNKHLPDLANAFAEKGDRVYFKRLLLPCSHFLDASYSMCVKLARLYPEQAATIAEVIISLKNTKEEPKESSNVN